MVCSVAEDDDEVGTTLELVDDPQEWVSVRTQRITKRRQCEEYCALCGKVAATPLPDLVLLSWTRLGFLALIIREAGG